LAIFFYLALLQKYHIEWKFFADTVGANEIKRSAIKTLKNPVKSHKKQKKANIFILLDVGTCWCTHLC
jgi:hypothetical protein